MRCNGWFFLVTILFLAPCNAVISPDSCQQSRGRYLLIVFPGARVPTKQYTDLASNISERINSSSGGKWALTVAFASFPTLYPDPLTAPGEIRRILSLNCFTPEDTFLAGHSLGGIVARTLADQFRFRGLILWAAFMSRRARSDTVAGNLFLNRFSPDALSYPIPVLTVGGDLDPRTRPTRIAVEFSDFLLSNSLTISELISQTSEERSTHLPHRVSFNQTAVFVLRDVTHSHFCNTDFHTPGDMVSSASWADAHRRIAAVTSAFMSYHIVRQPLPRQPPDVLPESSSESASELRSEFSSQCSSQRLLDFDASGLGSDEVDAGTERALRKSTYWIEDELDEQAVFETSKQVLFEAFLDTLDGIGPYVYARDVLDNHWCLVAQRVIAAGGAVPSVRQAAFPPSHFAVTTRGGAEVNVSLELVNHVSFLRFLRSKPAVGPLEGIGRADKGRANGTPERTDGRSGDEGRSIAQVRLDEDLRADLERRWSGSESESGWAKPGGDDVRGALRLARGGLDWEEKTNVVTDDVGHATQSLATLRLTVQQYVAQPLLASSLDVSSWRQSAASVRCKCRSHAHILTRLPVSTATTHTLSTTATRPQHHQPDPAADSDLDVPVPCEVVNDLAVSVVTFLLPERLRARYEHSQPIGRHLTTAGDLPKGSGLTWASAGVHVAPSTDGVVVTSPRLFTRLDGWVVPGVQYCTLLPPSFVAEWLMLDALLPA